MFSGVFVFESLRTDCVDLLASEVANRVVGLKVRIECRSIFSGCLLVGKDAHYLKGAVAIGRSPCRRHNVEHQRAPGISEDLR